MTIALRRNHSECQIRDHADRNDTGQADRVRSPALPPAEGHTPRFTGLRGGSAALHAGPTGAER